MKRAAIISLFLLTGTGVAAQNVPIPSELPLPLETPKLSIPSPISSSSYDWFVPHNGITFPVQNSLNSSRMIVSDGGYMPLVVRSNRITGLSGSRHSYPSLGFSNSVSLGHSWAVSDRITLYGDVYASDNMFHHTRFKDFGVSGRIRIQVAERLFINGYGNYSIYNSAGPQQMPSLMYPTNYFGGTVEFKVTEKFGLEGGAQRGYNAFTRQWETSYYILPVFY